MKKYAIYIIAIAIIISAFSWMLSSGKNTSGSAVAPTGKINEITLGLKDYNYYPNTVRVKAGDTIRINLDSSVTGCLRDFTIRDFGVTKYLKTPGDYVEFVANKRGTFTFACSMGMGTGVLIVE